MDNARRLGNHRRPLAGTIGLGVFDAQYIQHSGMDCTSYPTFYAASESSFWLRSFMARSTCAKARCNLVSDGNGVRPNFRVVSGLSFGFIPPAIIDGTALDFGGGISVGA